MATVHDGYCARYIATVGFSISCEAPAKPSTMTAGLVAAPLASPCTSTVAPLLLHASSNAARVKITSALRERSAGWHEVGA